MSDDQRPPFAKVALAAATRPLNLGVGATGVGLSLALVAGAATIGSVVPAVAVLGVSVATWAGLTAWDTLFDANLRKRLATAIAQPAAGRQTAPEELPSDLRSALDAAYGAGQRVREAMDAADALVAPHLIETWGECQALLDEAARVADRGARLRQYLDSVSPTALAADQRGLLSRADNANDPQAASAWREAAEARKQQLGTWNEIAAIDERIKAQLASAVTALDEIHARVIRMDAADLDAASAATETIGARVHEIRGDIRILERAAAATLTEVRG